MTPAELYDDHRRRPRQLGKLLNASAVGDVGSIVVGDALRLYIKTDGATADARITEARFQVFNAPAQVAAASALCELVAGMPIETARRLDAAAIRSHLGGLDHELLPPLPWGVTALRAAIAAFEHGDLTEDDEREAMFCRCHGIPEAVVRESIRVMDLQEPAQVVDATGAGSGCGSCRVDLDRLIAETREVAKPAAPPVAGPRAIPGRIGLMHRIGQVLTNEVNPKLAGIILEPWDLGDRTLVVRATGPRAAEAAARADAAAHTSQALGASPATAGWSVSFVDETPR